MNHQFGSGSSISLMPQGTALRHFNPVQVKTMRHLIPPFHLFLDFSTCYFEKHILSKMRMHFFFPNVQLIVISRVWLYYVLVKESCLWTLSIVQCFSKTQRFRNWICFRLQVKRTRRRKQIQFPKRCVFGKQWTMDKVHKHDSFKCNTPSSGHFIIYLYYGQFNKLLFPYLSSVQVRMVQCSLQFMFSRSTKPHLTTQSHQSQLNTVHGKRSRKWEHYSPTATFWIAMSIAD
jgi:hypothetical protein